MKKLIFISLVLLLLSSVFVFADESEMFVKTMPITRIYMHKFGYRVVYLKTDMTLADFYVPMRWFDEAGGKGVLIRGYDAAYPYFSIFWKQGEFHSVKLYVKDNLDDESWGSMDLTPEESAVFDIDALELDF